MPNGSGEVGGWGEADAQGANPSSPLEASRDLGPRQGACGAGWRGGGAEEVWEPGSPHTLAKLQSDWSENDSLGSPGDPGRLLKVAGACTLSVISGHTPQPPSPKAELRRILSGPKSSNPGQLGPQQPLPWALPEPLWSQGQAFRKDPRTEG